MYQKIIIAGYLGRDPELRYTPTGWPVAHLSVAANRRWTDRDGNQQDETIWFRVSAWGKQAEACNQYLTKGSPVLVEGRLRPDPNTGGPRIFKRADGEPGAMFEVNALIIRFLGRAHQAEEETADEGGEELPF